MSAKIDSFGPRSGNQVTDRKSAVSFVLKAWPSVGIPLARRAVFNEGP